MFCYCTGLEYFALLVDELGSVGVYVEDSACLSTVLIISILRERERDWMLTHTTYFLPPPPPDDLLHANGKQHSGSLHADTRTDRLLGTDVD